MLSLLLLPLALVAACDKVPLLAPTGSVITLIPSALTVSLNSELTIVATVIENGVASGGSGTGTTTRSGAGTPVQNGTLVTFTTTIGRIEPSEARTHNGQVSVKLITSGTSGNPTITAYSGGASTQTKDVKIGTAAAKTVIISSTPQALGSSGGSAQITATVTDDGGAPLGGVPVTFATDKGSISPSAATTDGSGNAVVTLTTTATAKVTATAGTITSAAITVTVNPFGLSAFTVSPSSTSAGTPVTFTVTPTSGANIANVRIDFGDGSNPRNLGPISAAQTVGYAYNSAGNYTATATVTDAAGGTGQLSTSVIIGSLPITLTPSPPTPLVNSPVTFTVGGIGSAQVDHYIFTFSDGQGPVTTTSPQTTTTFAQRGLKTIRVDVFGVGGGKLGTQSVTIDVQ